MQREVIERIDSDRFIRSGSSDERQSVGIGNGCPCASRSLGLEIGEVLESHCCGLGGGFLGVGGENFMGGFGGVMLGCGACCDKMSLGIY